MALTNRERMIMIIAGLAIGTLVFDKYILTPVLNKRSEMTLQKDNLQAEVEQAKSTLRRQQTLQKLWDQMQEAGLSNDIQAIEGKLFRHLDESSYQTGLQLTSIQPERLQTQGQIGQIEFMVSGTGSMDSVTRFLWNIEMAEIPLKINSLQLGANNENALQMSLQLQLSSIYLIEEDDTKESES
jgi:hypothetical protein